ncbi:MAG TPA: hypothetical protein VNY52_08745 [Solirubrobacteraceae bacterium]|nr:hypothetical protein [Solirubrobacteraceae bacterium]
MAATSVLVPFAALIRVASRIICLIVVASFVIFAVNQTSRASTHQQEELSGAAATAHASTAAVPVSHEGTVHRVIDEAATKLTSPFSGITAGSTSQWAIRGVGTVMALLMYGVGLGYLARVLRFRV